MLFTDWPGFNLNADSRTYMYFERAWGTIPFLPNLVPLKDNKACPHRIQLFDDYLENEDIRLMDKPPSQPDLLTLTL
ncbi:hypothetical protein TNCV_212511 [Trichonephila clavipes]|nr:hypothetical protein TNCV_212511 [Trichonephila clavipes]